MTADKGIFLTGLRIRGLRIKRQGLKAYLSPATLLYAQGSSSAQRSQRDGWFLDRFFLRGKNRSNSQPLKGQKSREVSPSSCVKGARKSPLFASGKLRVPLVLDSEGRVLKCVFGSLERTAKALRKEQTDLFLTLRLRHQPQCGDIGPPNGGLKRSRTLIEVLSQRPPRVL
jgi:hypothetical protein